ncbi:MAG: chorismate mutase [Bifidobacterium sp.]|nr:chorismate mutase [Bifidobacterium sp.]
MTKNNEKPNRNDNSQAKTPITSTLFFLGPEGSFTHQAAASAAEILDGRDGNVSLEARENVPSIIRDVEAGLGWGVIAWENSVEGYVVPNLDAVIDAKDLAGLSRLTVDIAFDAFVRADEDVAVAGVDDANGAAAGAMHNGNRGNGTQTSASVCDEQGMASAKQMSYISPLHEITAHPHGLAQCTKFTRAHNLTPVPASSNAAACRDVKPGQVALGPALCGKLYGLQTLERNVQDFSGAKTDFLVVAPRSDVRAVLQAYRRDDAVDFETIIAVIPLSTGPGVIAKLLDSVRDEGLNMTNLMSRPIKGHAGTYSFIITLDAAPWQANFSHLLHQIVAEGDWVKTLAVYPRGEHPNPPVDTWMLPQGGICRKRVYASDVETKEERELLW